MRVAGLLLGIVLATLTPGAVLSLLQEWAPVAMVAAGLAGAAVATAVIAYHKAMDNARRITAMERHIPKRSTDTPTGRPPTGAPAMPPATTLGSGAASGIADGRPEGGTQ